MAGLLILLALIAAGAGTLFLSEATTGVGILAISCFLGILARIAQADAQHKELKKLIAERDNAATPKAVAQAPVQG